MNDESGDAVTSADIEDVQAQLSPGVQLPEEHLPMWAVLSVDEALDPGVDS